MTLNKLNKMMEKMAEQQAQELEVKVGDENVPFEERNFNKNLFD